MTASQATDFHVGPEDNPDKYRLLHQVGRGGEAELWRADLPVAGSVEPVAIKIRSERAGDFDRVSARWNEQAEMLRFVRHPGVVGVREHFEGRNFHVRGEAAQTSERALFLVMNWVEGRPLHEWALMNRDAPDRLPRVLRHLEQVADVLDWLHSGEATPSRRPVVHGDLSPGNIMIAPSGQAMLVDFGLVRLASHRTGQAAGTPGFTAPEIWRSGEYSPASDRYAFGAIAYFALTGIAPSLNTEEIRLGLAAHPLVAAAPPAALGQLMSIFSERPGDRPPTATAWVRLLRSTAMTGTVPPTTQHSMVGAPSGPLTMAAPRPAAAPHQFAPATAHTGPPAARRSKLPWIAAAAVIVLVGGMILGAKLFGGGTQGTGETPAGDLAAPSTSALTTTAPRTTTTSASGSTATTGGQLIPASEAVVRRQTSPGNLVLSTGYGVDLDSLAPDWDVSAGATGHDIHLYTDSVNRYIESRGDVDFAPVTAAGADFETCQSATNFSSTIQLQNTQPNKHYCARTTDRRYAFLTVVDPGSPVVLDVTVWDPPRRP